MTAELTKSNDGGAVRFGKEMRKQFLFDEKYLNLNHGSFGTYPKSIREVLRKYQDDVEARPDHWIRYVYPKLLDESRTAAAKLVNAPVETVVFVPNATTGVNTILRSLIFEKGDHILYFATIYGACEKTVAYITETTPAESVKVAYTYPVEDSWLIEQFHAKVDEVSRAGGRVKVAIFDTVVSMPGVRMPFEALTAACKERGVLSCIDGAHGVGHVRLNLSELDPDFFVSNMHKWLYTPRGSALFYVPERNQSLLRSTLPTSHGFTPLPRPGISIHNPFPPPVKSHFVNNFEFVGTIDNAPYLCVPAAIKFRESIGGEEKILGYCQGLAKDAAYYAVKVFGTEVLNNKTETMTNACMANVRLPLHLVDIEKVGVKHGLSKELVPGTVRDWMAKTLVDDYGTFIALFWYGGGWWVRFSGQIYLEMADYEWGIETLRKLCKRVENGEFAVVKGKL